MGGSGHAKPRPGRTSPYQDRIDKRAVSAAHSLGRKSSWSGKHSRHGTQRHHSSHKSLGKTLRWRGQRLNCSSRMPQQRQSHAARSYLHRSINACTQQRWIPVGRLNWVCVSFRQKKNCCYNDKIRRGNSHAHRECLGDTSTSGFSVPPML